MLTAEPIQTKQHPKYGEIYFNTWLPMYTANRSTHKAVPRSGYGAMLRDSAEFPMYVINPSGNIYMPKNRHNLIHDMLATAFPNVPVGETIDHMDNQWWNDVVTNLQWLSKSENSARAHEAVQHHVIGRPVVAFNKVTGEDLAFFPTIAAAGRGVAESIYNNTGEVVDAVTAESRVRNCIDGARDKAYGCHWRLWTEKLEDLEGEVWRIVEETPADCVEPVQFCVSNKGRFKSTWGTPHYGTKNRYCATRMFKVGYINQDGKAKNLTAYATRLIYKAFVGEIPEGHLVWVDRSAPRLPNGAYRTFVEDLRTAPRGQARSGVEWGNEIEPTAVNEVVATDNNLFTFSKRKYNIPVSDFFVEDMDCYVRIKDGKRAIYDGKYAEALSSFHWIPDGSQKVGPTLVRKFPEVQPYLGKKMSMPTFVWVALEKRELPDGHVVKPINMHNEDLRGANLKLIQGTFRNAQRPAMQHVPAEYVDELQTTLLPMNVSIQMTAKAAVLSCSAFGKCIGHDKPVTTKNMHEYMDRLRAKYREAGDDYDAKNLMYLTLLKEYFHIMEAAAQAE